MLILKDKNGVVICEAQSVTESYNAIGAFIGEKRTMLSISVESNTPKGVTLNNIVDKIKESDLSEITITDENDTVIETYTEYSQLMSVCKSIMNGGMTIDITLCDKLDIEE